jgi:hypothetical protein
MAVETVDQLVNAMANNSSRIIIDKASISGQAAGTFISLWRATGQPGQGAVPTTAAVCNDSFVGSIQFTQQTLPATSYLGVLEGLNSVAGHTIEIHDRLMHMGGLNGTLTTAQTVNLDLNTNLAASNLDARKGDANFSDVQWWMEWYTATGTTAANATINVTYNDGTSGALSLQSLAATRPASFMVPLNSLIPAAASGKYIRDIDTSSLSISTGTAGNFGFTATRYRGSIYMPLANVRFTADWAALGLPETLNSSCLFPILASGATTSGNMRGTGKILHG